MTPERNRRRGEAVCLLCGTIVGDVYQGRFIHHQGCERPIRWRARLPRCCRCGGSLYFDPTLGLPRLAESEMLQLFPAAEE